MAIGRFRQDRWQQPTSYTKPSSSPRCREGGWQSPSNACGGSDFGETGNSKPYSPQSPSALSPRPASTSPMPRSPDDYFDRKDLESNESPGIYTVIHTGLQVSSSHGLGAEPLHQLSFGERVKVLEIRTLNDRVRGRISHVRGSGWISLVSLDCGHRFARRDVQKSEAASKNGETISDSRRSPGGVDAGKNNDCVWNRTGAREAREASARKTQARNQTCGTFFSNVSGRYSRISHESKHPKVSDPGTFGDQAHHDAKIAKPIGDKGKWNFDVRDGYAITLAKLPAGQIQPIEELATKEEAIKMVRENPDKYFGCEWINPGYSWPHKGNALVFSRGCTFYGSGFADQRQPDVTGAMKAEYDALPSVKKINMKPDRFTTSSLETYSNRKLTSKCPGRQEGLADLPGLKFLGKADPDDVQQGSVGDCWLLSAISALAEFEGAIRSLFQHIDNLNDRPNEQFNNYNVRLWDISGDPKTWSQVDVDVDERLLWDHASNSVFGCKPTPDHELWPCMLEKAVAAHCGGWGKIDGGQPTHAWRFLLGCPWVYTIEKDAHDQKFACFGAFNPNTKKWESMANSPHDSFRGLWPMEWPKVGGGGDLHLHLDEEETFHRMCLWEDANYIMCAGTCVGKDTQMTEGIVDGHAYSIIRLIENAGETEFDMIKMRNPWGKQEFTSGGWDDNGENWSKYPQVFEACGRPPVADDGVFWMERKDFFHYFKTIYLCATDVSTYI